jgi:hypothetical protein
MAWLGTAKGAKDTKKEKREGKGKKKRYGRKKAGRCLFLKTLVWWAAENAGELQVALP